MPFIISSLFEPFNLEQIKLSYSKICNSVNNHPLKVIYKAFLLNIAPSSVQKSLAMDCINGIITRLDRDCHFLRRFSLVEKLMFIHILKQISERTARLIEIFTNDQFDILSSDMKVFFDIHHDHQHGDILYAFETLEAVYLCYQMGGK